MNNIPKLKFKYLTLEETSNILSWTLKDTDNILSVKEGTLFLYPELKRLTKEDNIKDIIQDRYNNFIKENNNLREEYTTIWNEYNDKYMLEISNYLNIKWPKEYKEISVGIGLIPVCPRYIKEKAFDIHKKNKEDLIDTCMHELCHFLFFEKCKEIYPNWKYEDFDSPSLLWYLSEIIIDPILNSDGIQKIYKHKFKCYDIFYNVEIDNINLLDKITSIYKNNNIETAIKESYNNGLVVGTTSYGKGTVQETKKLLDGSMIKYTTQKWLTPDGNFINEKGVTPTNEVTLNEEYYNNPTIENDNQLNEALNLLTK